MMQQVNLLSEDLEPHVEPLTLRQLAMGWGAVVGVLLLVSAWQGFGLWRLADELGLTPDELQKQLDELGIRVQSTTTPLTEAEVRTEPQPELVREVAALRDEFRLQSRLIDVVEDYENADDGGFSGFLTDLASQPVEGLALDRIELTRGGSHILLSGETEAPVHVPQLLKRLADGDSFRGHRFDAFRLQAEDTGLLRFDIVGPAEENRG